VCASVADAAPVRFASCRVAPQPRTTVPSRETLSLCVCVCVCAPIDAQVTFFRVDHRLLDHLKDGILHIEVWAEQSTCVHCFRRRRSVLRQIQAGIDKTRAQTCHREEHTTEYANTMARNDFSFTSPDIGSVRRAYTEASMEAEIQGQKLTEVRSTHAY
jgi:hypothetical protein